MIPATWCAILRPCQGLTDAPRRVRTRTERFGDPNLNCHLFRLDGLVAAGTAGGVGCLISGS